MNMVGASCDAGAADRTLERHKRFTQDTGKGALTSATGRDLSDAARRTTVIEARDVAQNIPVALNTAGKILSPTSIMDQQKAGGT